ncbi:Nudix hydrolase domain-containing protein [Pleurotus pulmonarius]
MSMDLFRRFSARPAAVRTGHAQAHTDTKPLPAPARNTPPQPRFRFSPFSGKSTSQGLWSAQDFMLGVGMVIIQPETEKVVLCYDSRRKRYFFPKGRKDAGEAMETAVLREAYEESGFRASFLPLYIPSHAPISPQDMNIRSDNPVKSSEPFIVSTKTYNPRPSFNPFTKREVDTSRVYFIHWYVGQIPADAVREEGTGMPDELTYTSDLFTLEEASQRLDVDSQRILRYAWFLFQDTIQFDKMLVH